MPANFMLLASVTVLTVLSLGAWGETIHKDASHKDTPPKDTIYKCKNQQGGLLYQKNPCKADVEAVLSWTPAAVKTPPPAPKPQTTNEAFIIKQSPNGSYLLEGTANGKALTFMVDTGASLVSLPKSFAKNAHITCQQSVDMQTANGAGKGCSTTLKKLTFGPFFINDVTAVIVPRLTQPLLGMNVLGLFNITQEKGEMRLSKRD